MNRITDTINALAALAVILFSIGAIIASITCAIYLIVSGLFL